MSKIKTVLTVTLLMAAIAFGGLQVFASNANDVVADSKEEQCDPSDCIELCKGMKCDPQDCPPGVCSSDANAKTVCSVEVQSDCAGSSSCCSKEAEK